MPVVSDRRAILGYSWVGSDGAGQPLTDRPVFITYSFETTTAALGLNGRFENEKQAYIDSFRPLSAAAQATARAAFQGWDAASGVTFLEVPAGFGDIKVASFNFDLGGPYRSSQAAAYGGGGILFVSDKVTAPSTQLFLHEIGHNLGFKHSFEGTYTLDPAIDNYASTVMSYTSGGTSGETLGTLDRDAVTYLYGTSGEDGHQVLSWSWNGATYTLSQTAFDAGGRIRGVGGNNDIHGGLGADEILLPGGGTNVVDGGADNDRITVSNGLPGGSNTVSGGVGDDTIQVPMNARFSVDGGDGTDSLLFNAPYNVATTFSVADAVAAGSSVSNVETVVLFGSVQADRLTAGAGKTSLYGYGGDDVLTGGAGDDILNGGGGRDELYGRDGNDSLQIDVAGGLAGIVVDGGAGTDSASIRFTDNAARALTTAQLGFIGIESITVNLGDGSDEFRLDVALSGSSYVYGGGGDDVLRAGASSSLLNGGAGQDQLYAGLGFSFLFGGGDADRFVFGGVGSTIDQIEDFQNGTDLIDVTAMALRNVQLQSSGASSYLVADSDAGQFRLFVRQAVSLDDVLANVVAGSPSADQLQGTAARDLIRGGSGSDALFGGAGRDYFVGTAAELAGDRITDLALGDRITVSDAAYASFSFARSGSTVSLIAGSLDVGAANVRLVAAPSLLGGTDLFAVNRDGGLSDIDGNGHSDILWQNVGGAISSWGVTGNVRASHFDQNTYFADVAPSWNMVETFDMNGDSHADILWRNADGTVAAWQAQTSGGFDQASFLAASPGTAWKIAATGDVNGDGRDDILWRHDDGSISIWTSTGAAFAQNSYFHTSVGANWRVAGLADFNGDGRADILWREAGGSISEWLSTGGGFTENAFFDSSVSSASGWKVAALSDFDGDGRDDVAWRNDSGALSVWSAAASGGFAKNSFFATVDPSWSIAQAGDFNADGRADLLWRNAGGAISLWQSNGHGFDQNVLYDAGPSIDWTIQVHDLLI